MAINSLTPIPTPHLSVIIPVYNDWPSLDECLASVARQREAPSFEVIVVDDGSRQGGDDLVYRWSCRYPLTIVRQPHAGIAAARNRGIQVSKGSVILFVDADCRLEVECLSALDSAVANSPQHACFQLQLVGDDRGIVGRAEDLRLMAIQTHLLEPDGCIRYLNTSGFAIRRESVDVEKGVFDPAATRAEDTLLLAHLMQRGELPFFAAKAMVCHAIRLSLLECLRKDIRSAFLEGRTFDIIASKGLRIRVSHRERLRMLVSMWERSGRMPIGRVAWCVLLIRQVLQRGTTYVYRCSRIWPNLRAAVRSFRSAQESFWPKTYSLADRPSHRDS